MNLFHSAEGKRCQSEACLLHRDFTKHSSADKTLSNLAGLMGAERGREATPENWKTYFPVDSAHERRCTHCPPLFRELDRLQRGKLNSAFQDHLKPLLLCFTMLRALCSMRKSQRFIDGIYIPPFAPMRISHDRTCSVSVKEQGVYTHLPSTPNTTARLRMVSWCTGKSTSRGLEYI